MGHAQPAQKNRTRLAERIDLAIIRDLPYATVSAAQKLDLYLASGRLQPSPVIVWMHPGGFHEGDKDGSAIAPLAWINVIRLFQPALERGYAVASINYRHSQEAIFPALIHDIKAAVRWVKAHAAEYGFDPERVAAWGSSAGGYLAAMLATTGNVPALEDLSLGNLAFSSRVAAAVDWYGPIDFSLMDEHHLQIGQEAHVHEASSPESRLMGAAVNTIVDKCKAASPVTYVGPDSAPLFIQQGMGDPVIPYPQSVMLADSLKAALGEDKVCLELVPKVGHADPVFFSLENVHKVLDFLDRHLRR
ncbi:MAG: alpha/beta hydrolase [Syntrophaceae bacterium]|nr:alpha/beta hydrolase [Syntrophaceae bacterium]